MTGYEPLLAYIRSEVSSHPDLEKGNNSLTTLPDHRFSIPKFILLWTQS